MITRATKNMQTGPLRVLVVEDNADDALLLKRAFGDSPLSAQVDVIGDGQDAVDYLRLVSPLSGGEFPVPELLIIDLRMPRLDGWELLKWVRQQPRLKDLFVAVLSGSSCEADFDHAYACGADLCLSKPFRYEQLSGVVQRIARNFLRRTDSTLGTHVLRKQNRNRRSSRAHLPAETV